MVQCLQVEAAVDGARVGEMTLEIIFRRHDLVAEGCGDAAALSIDEDTPAAREGHGLRGGDGSGLTGCGRARPRPQRRRAEMIVGTELIFRAEPVVGAEPVPGAESEMTEPRAIGSQNKRRFGNRESHNQLSLNLRANSQI